MARLEEFRLEALLEGLRVVPPLGYQVFLGLLSECALLISDSGGIQEEASVLKRPVIVVRRSTERPEILGTFAELSPQVEEIPEKAAHWLGDPTGARRHLGGLETPYGDGEATGRTVRAIEQLLATDHRARPSQPFTNEA